MKIKRWMFTEKFMSKVISYTWFNGFGYLICNTAGVRGQVIGCVGSFYECGKKGKPKSHIKVYELQIDELIKKWPGKKKKNRSWVSGLVILMATMACFF